MGVWEYGSMGVAVFFQFTTTFLLPKLVSYPIYIFNQFKLIVFFTPILPYTHT